MSKKGINSYSIQEKVTVLPEAIVNSEGLRLDGRALEEFRPVFLKTGTVSQAAGSGYLEIGDSKVLVAIYGPRESRKAQQYSDTGRLNCDVKVAPFATPIRGKYGNGVEEKEFTSILLKSLKSVVALHTFPKTTVDVFALILQSGGSDLAALITCSSMALADAGIEMFSLVTATSVVRVAKKLLLDPSKDEETCHDGEIFVASTAMTNDVLQVNMSGLWSVEDAKEAVELCLDGCGRLDELVREHFKEQLEKESNS